MNFILFIYSFFFFYFTTTSQLCKTNVESRLNLWPLFLVSCLSEACVFEVLNGLCHQATSLKWFTLRVPSRPQWDVCSRSLLVNVKYKTGAKRLCLHCFCWPAVTMGKPLTLKYSNSKKALSFYPQRVTPPVKPVYPEEYYCICEICLRRTSVAP